MVWVISSGHFNGDGVRLTVLLLFLARTAPVVWAIKKSAQDFLVHDLATIEPAYASFIGSMYAGLVPSSSFYEEMSEDNDPTDGDLMFWLFEPESPIHDEALVIWFNGGPGCSSFTGNSFEMGPVTTRRYPAGAYGLDNQSPLEANPYTWTRTSHVMFVEQPHGTGFSTGPLPHNETEVARYFYIFLRNLFSVFDHLANKEVYLVGESYAGMYVPSIALYTHEQRDPTIHIAGIGLGNAWIDARVQGPTVIDFAWWHGMIDSSAARALRQEWENCKDGTNIQEPPPFHPFTIPDECGIMEAVLEAAGAGAVDWGLPNAYDVTTWDPYEILDSLTGTLHKFYNDPDVQDALHVHPHRPWSDCMPGATRRRLKEAATPLPGQILLAHDQPTSVVPYIAKLLDETNIRVLVYNGDRDMTTNSQGSEMALDAMEWNGSLGWATGDYHRGLWLPGRHTLGGYIKHYKNLQFLVVANSGHLVPFNVAWIALDLITRFVGNHSFMDHSLPRFNVKQKSHTSESHGQCERSRVSLDMTFAVCLLLVGVLLGVVVARWKPIQQRGYETVL